jgi:hypothetical protein
MLSNYLTSAPEGSRACPSTRSRGRLNHAANFLRAIAGQPLTTRPPMEVTNEMMGGLFNAKGLVLQGLAEKAGCTIS